MGRINAVCGATVTAPSRTGKTYRRDYSDTPGGPWVEVQTQIAGTGRDITVTDTSAATKPARFHRMVTLP